MPSHDLAYHGGRGAAVRQRFRGKRAGKQVLKRETAKAVRAKAKAEAQKCSRSSSGASSAGATTTPASSSYSSALSSTVACHEALVSPMSANEERLSDEMLATMQSEGWAGDVAMLRRAPALDRRDWDEYAAGLLSFAQEMQNLGPVLRALALGQPTYSAQAHVTALRLLVHHGDRCLRTSASLRGLLAEHASGTWLRCSDSSNRLGGLQAS